MRKNRKLRKILLTVCSAILLVCISVGATIAYLTDTEAVTNTFTVGQVGIKLDEAEVYKDPATGDHKPKYDENNKPLRTEDEQAYHLVPGATITKDPTITVDADSEDCYLIARIEVTAADMAKVREVLGYSEGSTAGFLGLNQIVSGGVFGEDVTYAAPTVSGQTATWTGKKGDKAYVTLTQTVEDGKNVFYVYYEQPYKATNYEVIFTTLEIPETWGNSELDAMTGLKIDVKAYAIQAAGFDNVKTAFANGNWK